MDGQFDPIKVRAQLEAEWVVLRQMQDAFRNGIPAEPTIEMVYAACKAFRQDISPTLAMHGALVAALAQMRGC